MTAVLLPVKQAQELEELVPVEIHPDVIYDSLQAATLLGFDGESEKARRNAIYRIPTEHLSRVRRAGGGRYGYPGWALIRYLKERTEGRPRNEGNRKEDGDGTQLSDRGRGHRDQ